MTEGRGGLPHRKSLPLGEGGRVQARSDEGHSRGTSRVKNHGIYRLRRFLPSSVKNQRFLTASPGGSLCCVVPGDCHGCWRTLAMTGMSMGIATPVCALARNDMLFLGGLPLFIGCEFFEHLFEIVRQVCHNHHRTAVPGVGEAQNARMEALAVLSQFGLFPSVDRVA